MPTPYISFMCGSQVYLWPDQMAHCLRDPDVLDLVSKEQLKLVLIEQFPEIHTYCPRLRVGPSAVLLFINSSIEPDAQVSRH